MPAYPYSPKMSCYDTKGSILLETITIITVNTNN